LGWLLLAGHYAAAYALRAARPSVPLWQLFVAVQAVDIVFFVFAVIGVEILAVNHGARGPLVMHLVSIPYTHSLAMNAIYAATVIGIATLLNRTRTGVVLAIALLSHWAFDVFVHTPDLPLTDAATTKVGLGLWHYPIAALALEIGLVIVAYAVLRRRLNRPAARRWADISAAVLVITQLIYVLGPPPTTVLQMAVLGEAIYLMMAVLAYQVDRHSR
jgi:hypothetical protein